MRRVILGSTGIETSALGFGCASLGSRVSATDGLRALAAAHEHGVGWFDVAPAYGRGQAETILSRFTRSRRSQLQICTKVGLAPPRSTEGIFGALAGRLVPLARRAISAVPALRGAVKKSGIQGNQKLPLTPELLQRSLEGSLRRLGTDHVDLYALHNASVSEVTDEGVLRALADIIASGKARAVAVASDAQAAYAAIGQVAPYGVVQFALPVLGGTHSPGVPSGSVLDDARSAGLGTIVHSVMGSDHSHLARRLLTDSQAGAICQTATGLTDANAILSRILVARAFAMNSKGIVILSMFSNRNLKANVAAAAGLPAPEMLGAIAAAERLAAAV